MFIGIIAVEATERDVATWGAAAFGIQFFEMDFAHVRHVGDVGLAVFADDGLFVDPPIRIGTLDAEFSAVFKIDHDIISCHVLTIKRVIGRFILNLFVIYRRRAIFASGGFYDCWQNLNLTGFFPDFAIDFFTQRIKLFIFVIIIYKNDKNQSFRSSLSP